METLSGKWAPIKTRTNGLFVFELKSRKKSISINLKSIDGLKILSVVENSIFLFQISGILL